MKTSFEITNCPLCGKELAYRQVAKVDVYECSEHINWNSISGFRDRPHYEVETNHKFDVQHIYIMPYSIDNYEGGSRIYRVFSHEGIQSWRFVFETNQQIKAAPSDELLKRIQKLLMFI